ncbi:MULTISPECIES: ABC transporter permease [unclassified Enterobacter]|uniref:ABC transporter permease n=1 Tax=unclassified Enterobacter TaxID=2608935 RepID=UPI0015C6A0D3|nr:MULTISPECIES: ABC transporter permease [unclassified Enterobacter]MBB3307814.1 putative spermidine/putrescine transport system permease protein [Enterobacter sp. Sphag1F]NYI16626.1 putative spermidine/putrescine transport system permease protein [Enterobacter sp. Sphag71]
MTRSLNDKMITLAGRALVVAILLFVLLPTIVVFISSFSSTSVLFFPPKGWSLRWFERAVNYDDFRHGFYSGLIVTAWASTLAVIIGATLAIAIERYSFPCKQVLEGVLLSPLFIPHFTIGLGLLMLVSQLGIGRGFPLVIFCHIVLVLPFVLRSVYVSLKNLEQRIELAAASLGASPLRVVWTITVPLILPGLFGGWLFAAILSFNEFTASLFITTQATQTLPVAMYNYVREFADPTLAALSVIYIAVTATMLIIANKFLGLGKILNVEAGH